MEEPQRFGLRPLNATALDPFLRRLLLDDCVVTRALRNHVSAGVRVSVEEQVPVPLPDPSASLLGVRAGSSAVRRRVAIGVDRCAVPVLLAESFVVPDRLPAGFLASLATGAEGIGAALESLEAPVRRELLCWGLADRVPWRPRLDADPVAFRLYRIVVDGWPAILINEAFLIEAVDGQLRLASAAVQMAAQS